MDRVSRRSLIGLNAVNFFLAEVSAVIVPFLAVYLKQKGWSYEQIGVATAGASAGTLVSQTPVGFICDRYKNRKHLLGMMTLAIGICYGLIPVFAHNRIWVDSLLFLSGVAGAFFAPLLATLALSLASNKKFGATMGENQGWNHAGNIAAALLSLWVVKALGVESIFFIMAAISIFGVLSLGLIKNSELDPKAGREGRKRRDWIEEVKHFLTDRRVLVLLAAAVLFNFANAPTMALLGLYLKKMGGSDENIPMIVLATQGVMIPVSYFAGKYAGHWGRKWLLTVAFLLLPLRIFLYTTTTHTGLLLVVQSLDGIGAGIYGVLIALMCRDITDKKGGFNGLMGLVQTASAFGALLGPLMQGYVTEHHGFIPAFWALATAGGLGAILFVLMMPETKVRADAAAAPKAAAAK